MKRHITSIVSQTFGHFASKQHSKPLQNIINHTYVKLMGLDMSDFQAPKYYESLTALFTRHLKNNRTFSSNSNDMISPCDSFITACGLIEENLALQIKGMSYSIDEVLGDKISQDAKQSIKNGTFINFYLSPRDYHRYHVPIDMQILHAVHIPGKLYPVNIPSLKKRVNLFIENERVILECLSTSRKRFFIILVGALNVGKIEVNFESRIQTNTMAMTQNIYRYNELFLNRGDDFGCFHMGSTIVMLCEKEMIELNVKTDSNVLFGQTIAHLTMN